MSSVFSSGGTVYRFPASLFPAGAGRLVTTQRPRFGQSAGRCRIAVDSWLDLWSLPPTSTVVDVWVEDGVIVRGSSRLVAHDPCRCVSVTVRAPSFDDDKAAAEWMAEHFHGGSRLAYMLSEGAAAMSYILDLGRAIGLREGGLGSFCCSFEGRAIDVDQLVYILPTWACTEQSSLA